MLGVVGVNCNECEPDLTHFGLPEGQDSGEWDAILLPELSEEVERFISEDHSADEFSELILKGICELHAFCNSPTSPGVLGDVALKATRNKVFSIGVLVTSALDRVENETSSEKVDLIPSLDDPEKTADQQGVDLASGATGILFLLSAESQQQAGEEPSVG